MNPLLVASVSTYDSVSEIVFESVGLNTTSVDEIACVVMYFFVVAGFVAEDQTVLESAAVEVESLTPAAPALGLNLILISEYFQSPVA